MKVLASRALRLFLFVALSVLVPTAGHAVTYYFNSDHITGGGGATDYGTVDITLNADFISLDIAVSLLGGSEFINTGSHQSFDFSLAGDPAISYTPNPPTGFAIISGTDFHNNGTGSDWGYALMCNNLLNGANSACGSTLSFTITPTVGALTLASIIASDAGYFFAADIISGFNGLTGPIAATRTPSEVPLPAALPLFASDVVGAGLLGWRKRRNAVH